MHILYKLTFASGKSYIGQTVRALPIRIIAHRTSAKNGSQLPVHAAWRKYGEPEIAVIAEFDSHDELHAAEIAAIAEHQTRAPGGYNISIGGDTAPSKNPEVAAKIAAKAKGRKLDPKFSGLFSEVTKRHWQNPEYREKVSAGLKAAWTEEKRRERGEQAKANWEKRRAAGLAGHSEETKAKIAAKARNMSDETRRRMSESAKKRIREPKSAETRAKIAENSRRQGKDPELMARRAEAISKAHAARTPEQKAADTEKRLASRERNKLEKLTQ